VVAELDLKCILPLKGRELLGRETVVGMGSTLVEVVEQVHQVVGAQGDHNQVAKEA
jgi:hypothetical protein